MSTENFDNMYRRLHKMATFFLHEMGEIGLVEATIDAKLFDIVFDHSVKSKLFLYPGDGSKTFQEVFDEPLKTGRSIVAITINIQGRPVIIRRAAR